MESMSYRMLNYHLNELLTFWPELRMLPDMAQVERIFREDGAKSGLDNEISPEALAAIEAFNATVESVIGPKPVGPIPPTPAVKCTRIPFHFKDGFNWAPRIP